MGFVIGIVIAIGTLFWAVTRLLDGASDAKFAWRRFLWLRKSTKTVSQTVTDPRESAAVALLQVVAYAGTLTDEDVGAVKVTLLDGIAQSTHEADELLAVARLVLNDVTDANNKLRQFVNPIKQACTVEERADLIEKMRALASRTGEPSDVQTVFIDRFGRALLE